MRERRGARQELLAQPQVASPFRQPPLPVRETGAFAYDAAEFMGKGYEEIKAAAAKHCADATANVPTRHLPKASHGAHMG